LNPVERARGFQRLIEEFNLSLQNCPTELKKPSLFFQLFRLLTLRMQLKDGNLSGLFTEGHARAWAQLLDPKLMSEATKLF
jgi:hypothetical protein